MEPDESVAFLPLTVTGLPTSGKGPLVALLDGGQEIECAIPLLFHDVLTTLLPLYAPNINDNSTKVAARMGEDKRAYFLRRLLILHSAFYITLESVFQRGYVNFILAAEKFIRVPVAPPQYDFFELEKRIITELRETDSTDPQVLYQILVTNILKAFGWSVRPSVRYCVSCGSCTLQDIGLLLNAYPGGRVIFLDRPLEEAVGISFIREAKAVGIPFADVLKRMRSDATGNWLKNIVSVRKQALDYSRLEPERVLVLNFEELITDAPASMRKVCAFLNVEWQDIYARPTIFGQPLPEEEFFTVQDNIRELLTAEEYELLAQFIQEYVENPLPDGENTSPEDCPQEQDLEEKPREIWDLQRIGRGLRRILVGDFGPVRTALGESKEKIRRCAELFLQKFLS